MSESTETADTTGNTAQKGQLSHVVILTPDLDARLITFQNNHMIYYIGRVPLAGRDIAAEVAGLDNVSVLVDEEKGTYNLELKVTKDTVTESLEHMKGILARTSSQLSVPREELVEPIYGLNEEILRRDKLTCIKPEGVVEVVLGENARRFYWEDGYFHSVESSFMKYRDLERKIRLEREEELFGEGIETKISQELNIEAAHFMNRANAFIDMATQEEDVETRELHYLKAFQDYERAKIVLMYVTGKMLDESPDDTEKLGFLHNIANALVGQAKCMYYALEMNCLFDGFEHYISLALSEVKSLQVKAQEIIDGKYECSTCECDDDEPEGWIATETYDRNIPSITTDNPISTFVDIVGKIQYDVVPLKDRMRFAHPDERVRLRLEIDHLEKQMWDYSDHDDLLEYAAEIRDEIIILNSHLDMISGSEDVEEGGIFSVREALAKYDCEGNHEETGKARAMLTSIESNDPLFFDHPEEIPFSSFFCYLC